MDYNVEREITQPEVERFGKDTAIARAMLDCWQRAVIGARPKRSLVLRSSEIEECSPYGPFVHLAYRIRCRFETE